jgi:hypothetical protein
MPGFSSSPDVGHPFGQTCPKQGERDEYTSHLEHPRETASGIFIAPTIVRCRVCPLQPTGVESLEVVMDSRRRPSTRIRPRYLTPSICWPKALRSRDRRRNVATSVGREGPGQPEAMPGAGAMETGLTPSGIARAPAPLGIPHAYPAPVLGTRVPRPRLSRS